MRSVEQSLLRLGTDRLDLLLIHDVDVSTMAAILPSRTFARRSLALMRRWTSFCIEGVVALIGTA